MLIITLAEFKKMVAHGVALVDFDVFWPASSRIQQRIIDALARQFSGSAWVAAVDVDTVREIAATFHITHVPTLALFKEGREIRRFIGLQPEEILRMNIEQLLPPPKPAGLFKTLP